MSKTVPLQTAQKLTPALKNKRKFWFVLCVGLIVVFLLLSFLIGRATSAHYIHIHSSNELGMYETKELKALAHSMGEYRFYQADLDEIRDRVLALSWVDAVSVRRDWRYGVAVEVRPKKAVASFGGTHFLDANGTAFVPANKKLLSDERLVNLRGSEKEASTLMQKTKKLNEWFAPLGLAAKTVTLTDRHTWLIEFNTGLKVLVDYDRVDEKLYTLSHILADQRNHLSIKQIKTIDLRYKNGFSIAYKTPNGQA